MMVKENVKPCGLYLKLPTRRVDTYLTFISGGKKFLRNCMSSAWIKDMLIVISLQSGKRLADQV